MGSLRVLARDANVHSLFRSGPRIGRSWKHGSRMSQERRGSRSPFEREKALPAVAVAIPWDVLLQFCLSFLVALVVAREQLNGT